MDDLFQSRYFRDIDLNDPFFDSLKSDYAEFEDWFSKKGDKPATVIYGDHGLLGFLFVKVEPEMVSDIEPPLPPKRRLKIGTFKVEAHGTKLGERFMKKILDLAIYYKVEEMYVTVFAKHEGLISLFTEMGFKRIGLKTTQNGTEEVFGRVLRNLDENVLHAYPFFNSSKGNKYLLAIYPEFHTQLFSDSILNNEDYSIVKDVSHTNSIHKIYIGHIEGMDKIQAGDLVVIYRTKDDKGPAEHRSVATSVCVVEAVKPRSQFSSQDDFLNFCRRYSLFNEQQLQDLWKKWPNDKLCALKLTYNAAFSKRVKRGILIQDIGLDREARWGLLKLSHTQFKQILELGGVSHYDLADEA